MKRFAVCVVMMLSSLSVWAEGAANPVEGVNYHVLGTPEPTVGPIEVAEFFWLLLPSL